jgi:hypothetical protein
MQRFAKEAEQLVNRKLPIYAGKTAKRHFQDNFLQGGFVNGGLHPWTPAKRLNSGGTDAASKYKTLMSSRKNLYSSINYQPAVAKVTLYTDVIYAPTHQDGAVLHPAVTPKMRRYAWYRYYSITDKKRSSERQKKGKGGKSGELSPIETEEAQMWKQLALTRKTKLNVKIPARPFMGKSVELDAKIASYVEREIIRILNS